MPLILSPLLLGEQKIVSHGDAAVNGATVRLLAANPNRTTAFIFNAGTVAARLGEPTPGQQEARRCRQARA